MPPAFQTLTEELKSVVFEKQEMEEIYIYQKHFPIGHFGVNWDFNFDIQDKFMEYKK